MTDRSADGEAFKAAREAIGWSIRQVADMLWIDASNLRACEEGRRQIPAAALVWIEKIAAAVKENPAPIVVAKTRLRKGIRRR